jgi:hypothetical protein
LRELIVQADKAMFPIENLVPFGKAVECFRTDAQRFGSLHRGENVGVILKHLQFLLS